MGYKTLGIVIPNFNYAKFLPRLLHSINNSSYRDFIKIYFIDGLSTDNSLELAETYLKESDVIISEADDGQADAIQKGLSLCNEDWFIFQNSDDFFDTETLDYIFVSNIINSNFDVLAFSTRFISDDSQSFFKHSLPIKYGMLFWNIFFCNQSTVYKTKIAKSVRFTKTFKFALDYDFIVRFFKYKRNVYYSPLILGTQCMHDQTKTAKMQHICLSEKKFVQKSNFSFMPILVSFPYYIFYVVHKKFISLLRFL